MILRYLLCPITIVYALSNHNLSADLNELFDLVTPHSGNLLYCQYKPTQTVCTAHKNPKSIPNFANVCRFISLKF